MRGSRRATKALGRYCFRDATARTDLLETKCGTDLRILNLNDVLALLVIHIAFTLIFLARRAMRTIAVGQPLAQAARADPNAFFLRFDFNRTGCVVIYQASPMCLLLCLTIKVDVLKLHVRCES